MKNNNKSRLGKKKVMSYDLGYRYNTQIFIFFTQGKSLAIGDLVLTCCIAPPK